ncbi:hypothetical protein Pan153_55360 [Gimesia panareensis]|uniref:Uncharacterized protein n=1 Tax=Gimesia panareensis TaxID=2527978 RepID=A0A518FWU5_9PLAN|nr:hypothetical protein [Gimesia panareensis]QDV20857.1 hypothetical protein Pan153_55360 [Gimesia panareensis]
MSQKPTLDQYIESLKKGRKRNYILIGILIISLMLQEIFTARGTDVFMVIFTTLFIADLICQGHLISVLELLKENPAPQPEPETMETVAS